MPEPIKRKLTTVLCADVKGYSRLMSQDEVATLTTLGAYREAIDDLIARHQGRVFSAGGDSVLAEFPSVVEAVQCAVEVQQEVGTRNHDLAPERRMQFRIGLNLGDVMVKGDDLFGEGVNVAARLQEIAEPGGICISGTVYDHVRNKVALGFAFMGDRSVKNIPMRIPVYRVETAGSAGRAPPARDDAADDSDGTDDEDVRRQVRAERRFYRRAAGFGGILALLFLINMLTSPGDLWVQWPALGFAVVLAMDGIRTFVSDRHFGAAWEERRRREIQRRRREGARSTEPDGRTPRP